eukprot:m.138423 g.138423  ORF g.138423 m.138423 type:complete len:149 (-) comp29993_c0_seq3:74-520(-)
MHLSSQHPPSRAVKNSCWITVKPTGMHQYATKLWCSFELSAPTTIAVCSVFTTTLDSFNNKLILRPNPATEYWLLFYTYMNQSTSSNTVLYHVTIHIAFPDHIISRHTTLHHPPHQINITSHYSTSHPITAQHTTPHHRHTKPRHTTP